MNDDCFCLFVLMLMLALEGVALEQVFNYQGRFSNGRMRLIHRCNT